MFPAKMVKELLYAMFSQKYVSITEIAKTADHAPSRTFYCFNVPMEQLTKQLLEHNYRTILNLMTKRSQILTENRLALCILHVNAQTLIRTELCDVPLLYH